MTYIASFLKFKTRIAANKADASHVVLSFPLQKENNHDDELIICVLSIFYLVISQFGKRIDNDTKDDVQCYDRNDDEVGEIKEYSQSRFEETVRLWRESFAQSPATQQTKFETRDKTLAEIFAVETLVAIK